MVVVEERKLRRAGLYVYCFANGATASRLIFETRALRWLSTFYIFFFYILFLELSRDATGT